jgi:hypothetical protein
MWHYVALFLYKAKIEIHCVFDKFVFFIVALCGTMWHYFLIKQKLKYIVFLTFSFFLHCDSMWHYVALFLQKNKKINTLCF